MRICSLVSVIAAAACGSCSAAPATSWLITNAVVVDGSGSPGRGASVRIAGDTIAEVGDLSARRGEPVVDARGMTLAPGFIDTHSHADDDLQAYPDALAAVSQGITTIVGGQDGGSPLPLAAYFDSLRAHPVAVNVAMYSGHGSIRRAVLGEDFRRAATRAEVDSMRTVLAADLAAGALGLSSGLEYDPGIYSKTDELLALARDVSAVQGRYISHIRSEDFAFWPAIDEIVRIGREAKLPVQVSHVKLAMRGLWGRSDSLVGVLDRARADGVDITADIYPYPYWQSTLTVLFPRRDFTNRTAAEFALTQTSTPGGLLLGRYAPRPEYAGKTVADVAALRGVDSVTALIDLIREAEAMKTRLRAADSSVGGVESVIGTSMTERDIERLMQWPFTNFCTDGSLDGAHPRGFGSYPRVFGRYVRERKVMSLEEAVRRATRLAAANMGIRGRGTIARGNYADLVLFDAATMADNATTRAPHALSAGVQRVWVNGIEVYAAGKASGARPGRALTRK